MAQLWMQGEMEEDGRRFTGAGWVVRPITGDNECLAATGPQAAGAEREGGGDPMAASLLRAGGSGSELWAVLGSQSVFVNGDPLLLGIRVLTDRDELRIGGEPPFYFSSERLAKVEPFPGVDRRTFCARCKTEIYEGTPAVKCPNCNVWCHESGSEASGPGSEADALPCWSYPGTVSCPMCGQSNDFDAGYRWTPEGL